MSAMTAMAPNSPDNDLRSLRVCLPQELERVRRPVAPADARNAPQHAERLDGARRLDRAHVLRIPAELVEDLADDSLGLGVIATDEHGGSSISESLSVVKYDSTPLTGGPPPIGLQASITGFPSSAPVPTSFNASSAASPATASTTTSPKVPASANDLT